MRQLVALSFGLLAASMAIAQPSTEAQALNERLLKEAPAAMRQLGPDEFCVGYGNALRMNFLPNGYDGDSAGPLARAEAKRRGLKFSDKDVKAETLRLGMTQCQLMASWGQPREQNRSVGSWGVDIQHVYSSAYVYTRNGVVRSWQD